MSTIIERPTKSAVPKSRAKKAVPNANGALPRSWKNKFPIGASWPVIFWLSLIHAGALLAFVPALFSWSGVALTFGLHWLTGGIGVCLGYHRMLTHDGFKTFRPIRNFLAVMGSLAGEGGCLQWTTTHRRHHAFSDQEGDPHSPYDGAWWSHIVWTAPHKTREQIAGEYARWVPDLKDDASLKFIDSMFVPWHFLLASILFASGCAIGGLWLGLSWIVWGMFVRLTFVMHSTWFVNSASHMWGYRNYETSDDSRNNWWVALLTYGEGWHNNHHAYPRMARHGHRWWEFDATFLTIRLMQRLGLAWDVVDHKSKRRDEQTDDLNNATRTAEILAAHGLKSQVAVKEEPVKTSA